MKFLTTVLGALTLAGACPLPCGAQTAGGTPERSASAAAEAFRLDLGAPADPATPADDAAADADAPAGGAAPTDTGSATVAAPPQAGALFTLDTPIEALIADARARAVLDKDLPGLSGDENLSRFRMLSLRRFQPLTGGQLTAELLGQVEADLAAIPRGVKPGKGRNAPR